MLVYNKKFIASLNCRDLLFNIYNKTTNSQANTNTVKPERH